MSWKIAPQIEEILKKAMDFGGIDREEAVEPCPLNCLFCSLTEKAGIFTEKIEFPLDDVMQWARIGEENQADALNIMTTGSYSFAKLLEVGKLLKKTVSVPLVANTRDITHKEDEQLLETGFVGAYHAVRLGEGMDTPLKVQKRQCSKIKSSMHPATVR